MSSIEILSFNSSIILSAVFKPIPFTDLILLTSELIIALLSSSADIDDKIIIAVLGPTPLMDNKIKNGSYTKPNLRRKLFVEIKAANTHGTAAGKWSARKAQLLAKKYKALGGGYY